MPPWWDVQEDDLDEDAENSGKGGCGLGGNLDVAVCRAEWYFHLGGYQASIPQSRSPFCSVSSG